MKQQNNRFADSELSPEAFNYLTDIARQARGDILTMTTLAASGHPGGSMSSIDIYLALYYFLNITPENCCEGNRDMVVVSHGHTSPGVYSALGRLGFFDLDEAVAWFRKAGSPYEGHVERHLNGVEWSTGNLGQGLSVGCGLAVAARIKGMANHVFVVMGDGEQQKGQLGEARRFAKKHDLKNLYAVVDLNGLQISGAIGDIMFQDIGQSYRADGWVVYETDGHDLKKLYTTFREMITNGGPAVLLAKTVMGKGVSFMENIKDYHGKTLTAEQYGKAIVELGVENRLEAVKARRDAAVFTGEHPRTSSEFPALRLPDAVTYSAERKIDNRSAFGEALVALAKANTGGPYLPVAVFDCDLAGSVKVDGFEKNFPANFFQSGIQEHNTSTLAGAVSVEGIVPVFADFGVFGVDEVYNQQRLNDINAGNVKVVCTHVGIDVGEDGKTHQSIDYLGLLRNTFGFRAVVPADGNQTWKAVVKSLAERGNCFIGMGRSVTPIISREDGTPFFDDAYCFEYGRADIIREGTGLAILAYGVMLFRALKVRELLAAQGIDAMVVNVACPFSMDEAVIRKAAATGKMVTYEDHNVNTGLGAILADFLYGKKIFVDLLKLGVTGYGFSGKPEEVFDLIGLSPEKAAGRIQAFLK